MGKRDDNNPRDTLELDPAQLAALTKQARQAIAAAVPGAREDEVPVAVGRASTLVDPLTTSLLAEVARRSQTQEFDDDVIEEMLDEVGKPAADTPHPHTKRRAK
jgi:hypothetical protein